MEERSLRQCKGDWRPNGEKERVREEARTREENVHERMGQTSDGWEGERWNEVHGTNERKRRTVRNQRGNPRRGCGVEESQPTERLISPARCGVPNARRTVDFSRVLATWFRSKYHAALHEHVRSPVPSGIHQPTPINFGTSLDRQLRRAR